MDGAIVVRMVSGVLAVIVLAIIVMRRRQKALD